MTDAAIAVFIALLALAPFFLIAVLGRYWIQRAPTDDAAKRRRKYIYLSMVYIVIALEIWEHRETITETKLWRRFSGTCCVVLSNNSGVEVTDLEMALRASGDLEPDVRHNDSMPSNSRTWIKTRADEFKVERLTGVAGTNRFSFTGVAKKGERLVIAIEAGGRIAARVE